MRENTDHTCSQCARIEELNARIRDLQTENRDLDNTVGWMHQLIWDLLARNRSLLRQMEALTSEDDPH
ncbi:MAG: hypothetical protein LUE65_11270 [Clostridiales bacterium]|nr:hypothetical protein [Clostridiales bacterium]MCD8371279.1 hypothetical protein [Clostridiales bacterium]